MRPVWQRRGATSWRSTLAARFRDDSGLTRYRIARETGLSQSTLAQFSNGHRGLSMTALDALGEFLQRTITSGRKPDKKAE